MRLTDIEVKNKLAAEKVRIATAARRRAQEPVAFSNLPKGFVAKYNKREIIYCPNSCGNRSYEYPIRLKELEITRYGGIKISFSINNLHQGLRNLHYFESKKVNHKYQYGIYVEDEYGMRYPVDSEVEGLHKGRKNDGWYGRRKLLIPGNKISEFSVEFPMVHKNVKNLKFAYSRLTLGHNGWFWKNIQVTRGAVDAWKPK